MGTRKQNSPCNPPALGLTPPRQLHLYTFGDRKLGVGGIKEMHNIYPCYYFSYFINTVPWYRSRILKETNYILAIENYMYEDHLLIR